MVYKHNISQKVHNIKTESERGTCLNVPLGLIVTLTLLPRPSSTPLYYVRLPRPLDLVLRLNDKVTPTRTGRTCRRRPVTGKIRDPTVLLSENPPRHVVVDWRTHDRDDDEIARDDISKAGTGTHIRVFGVIGRSPTRYNEGGPS